MWSSGFRVWGAGFRVWVSRASHPAISPSHNSAEGAVDCKNRGHLDAQSLPSPQVPYIIPERGGGGGGSALIPSPKTLNPKP